MSDITDGASNTYLLGEEYMWPDHYADGTAGDDDQCWSVGYDYDVNRWTNKDGTVADAGHSRLRRFQLPVRQRPRDRALHWRFVTARSSHQLFDRSGDPVSPRE